MMRMITIMIRMAYIISMMMINVATDDDEDDVDSINDFNHHGIYDNCNDNGDDDNNNAYGEDSDDVP